MQHDVAVLHIGDEAHFLFPPVQYDARKELWYFDDGACPVGCN